MNTVIYNLKRRLRISSFGRSKFYLALRYYLKKNQIEKFIKIYEGDVTPERKSQIKKMMFEAMTRYRWDFDEFYIFHYENIDDVKRKSFAPEYDKNIFADLVNSPEQADVFLDKWHTYEYFKEFFGRDVYNIRSIEDIESTAFERFFAKHSRFILKPVFGTRGAGIEVVEFNNVDDAKRYLSDMYKSGVTAIIIEELIIQHDKLAELHKESANTLRVISIRYEDRVEVIHAYLRVGKGSSVIDNASAGGVFGVVNIETGKIYAACDRWGNTFDVHPDSGKHLIGFEVPKWNEVKELVAKAAQVLPDVHYVGWDVAVTNNGCVLIEGNDKGRWSFQFAKQEGFRDEMNAILRRLGKPEINV